MNDRSKTKKELFLKTLNDGKGIITYACQKTGISRQTYYNWLREDEDFASKVEEINESTIDIVESKLLGAINDDNLTAIIFYLKTKGKKRGYVERTEHDVNSSPFLELMQSLPDEEDVE